MSIFCSTYHAYLLLTVEELGASKEFTHSTHSPDELTLYFYLCIYIYIHTESLYHAILSYAIQYNHAAISDSCLGLQHFSATLFYQLFVCTTIKSVE